MPGSSGGDGGPGSGDGQNKAGDVVVLGGGGGKPVYGFEDAAQAGRRIGRPKRGHLSGEALVAILGARFVESFDDTIRVDIQGISGAQFGAPTLVPGHGESS